MYVAVLIVTSHLLHLSHL